MTTEQAVNITDELFQLYKKHGGAEYAGEKITQLEHMAQAAQLADQEGYDEEVVLAAFLHDIGHICVSAGQAQMDGFGTLNHEEIGAAYLTKKGFSRRIVRLVESHVEAKRWLVLKEPGYYEQLSEASRKTLEYQGGPMSTEEAAAFEQYPLFGLIINMRKWDEQAKIEELPLPDLGHYRGMMIRHLEQQGSPL